MKNKINWLKNNIWKPFENKMNEWYSSKNPFISGFSALIQLLLVLSIILIFITITVIISNLIATYISYLAGCIFISLIIIYVILVAWIHAIR